MNFTLLGVQTWSWNFNIQTYALVVEYIHVLAGFVDDFGVVLFKLLGDTEIGHESKVVFSGLPMIFERLEIRSLAVVRVHDVSVVQGS